MSTSRDPVTRIADHLGARQLDGSAGSVLDASTWEELRGLLQRNTDAAAQAADLQRMLEPLSPDPTTAIAAVAFPLVETGAVTRQALDTCLPLAVRGLLDQLLTIGRVGRDNLPDDESSDAEGLRRLLLALVSDVRVVLVALAWQLVRLRAAPGNGDEGRRLARETRLIHAPLANRLGVWQLKWQLEDLSFRFLEPESYRRIARLVDERRGDRETFINTFMQRLRRLLTEAGIQGEVSGRAKHIYSIWRKMQRKGLDFHELFDVRAVRVLVDSVPDCYSVLGLVHTQWRPVPGEFDDYITNPKSNLYQSLHTAVTGPEGRAVEIQIRTHDMHRHAELGVAAHWRYKEGGPGDEAFERRVNVMRQLLDSGDEALDDASLLDNFESLTSEDRVYALTPRGKVLDLAAGATVLDFAYQVHTEVGHRCKGARVNGRIVPLTTALNNGDRVEILTGKEPRPSRDWLSPRLGYVRTGRTRAKIRAWFRKADYGDNLADGRQAVDAELDRLGLSGHDLGKVLERFNVGSLDDLYAAVGSGDLSAVQVGQAVLREHGSLDPARLLVRRRPAETSRASRDEVRIEGVGNLLYQMARCCRPLPGDEIAGYLTRTRGLSIHRRDCPQLLRLSREQPERITAVSWGGQREREYQVRIELEAWDRKELLKDIGSVVAAEGVSVAAIRAAEPDDTGEARLWMTVRVSEYEQLSGLLGRLQTIQGMIRVRRVE